MNNKQISFQIFDEKENENQTALNNTVLDNYGDMEILEPTEDIIVEEPYSGMIDTNLDKELEMSFNEIEQQINRLEDTLDLARQDVEVELKFDPEYHATDLGGMQQVNIISQQPKNEAISLADGKDVKLSNPKEYGKVNILTIGIGECGVNAIGRMYNDRSASSNSNMTLVAMDTSRKSLSANNADHKILLGEKFFKGHGSGGNHEAVAEAIASEKEQIVNILKDVHMIFITGGIGRGTGSVGLVEIGKIALEANILTIGFAIIPEEYECDSDTVKRFYNEFIDSVDANVTVEKDRVNEIYQHLPMLEAAKMADKMLVDGIQGISELITNVGKINLDYADVKTVFENKGSVVMGIGYGTGENAVIDAINQAIKSDIVNFNNIKNAHDIIVNLTFPRGTVTMEQAEKGMDLIYEYNDGNQIGQLLFGFGIDEKLENKVKVTFVATGTKTRDLNEITYRDGVENETKIPNREQVSININNLNNEPTLNLSKSDGENSGEKKLEMPNFFDK